MSLKLGDSLKYDFTYFQAAALTGFATKAVLKRPHERAKIEAMTTFGFMKPPLTLFCKPTINGSTNHRI